MMQQQHQSSDIGLSECIDLVKRALPNVGPGYFRSTTTYEPSGIVRERVFCYELYHRIRSEMERRHKLSLNGEIDKRKHPDFPLKHRRNPDFVFHIAGTHDGNTVVVEVKGSLKCRTRALLKDFDTLLLFTECHQYKAGVFILYNHSLDELTKRLQAHIPELTARTTAESVYIFCIKGHGCEVEESRLSLL